jgi:hypothetical protein
VPVSLRRIPQAEALPQSAQGFWTGNPASGMGPRAFKMRKQKAEQLDYGRLLANRSMSNKIPRKSTKIATA